MPAESGAASPKETWLRLLPSYTGIWVVGIRYWPFAILDMGWEDYRVSAEYDGDHHQKDRPQYVKDHKRQRKLENMGWINIRVINEDDPGDVIARVREALRSRGWRP